MLTSTIVSYPDRDNRYGSNKYRGNCSGLLIKDLLEFYTNIYDIKKVFDPMAGSGTTKDVCKELGIENLCLDLNPAWGGFDALNDEIPESSDFIFWHPPYFDIVKYSGVMYGQADPRDLSRCKDYQEFIKKLDKIQAKLITSLRKNGRIAILVGDLKKKGLLFSMQKDMSWFGAPEQVVLKVQNNCWSDNQSYNGKFIPIKHEYLLIFKRSDCYVLPAKVTKQVLIDLRQSEKITWRDVVLAAVESLGGQATLSQLYKEIEGHKKCKTNNNWKEKIRQVVQSYKEFKRIGEGKYALAS